MAIVITGDLDWTGALILFLEALDGGPAADIAGYTFTSSGDIEYSCSVPEPVDPEDRLLGLYRCVAKTSGGVIAGAGYVMITANTTAVYISSERATALDVTTQIVNSVLNTALTESYAADGVSPTLTQAILLVLQHMSESSVNGLTKTVKKLDGTTIAATFTLDSATRPTTITRST